MNHTTALSLTAYPTAALQGKPQLDRSVMQEQKEMTLTDLENEIYKLERRHRVSKWGMLIIGIWLFALPLLPDAFPYINWLRAKNPDSLYTYLGVASIIWAFDNWKSTKKT